MENYETLGWRTKAAMIFVLLASLQDLGVSVLLFAADAAEENLLLALILGSAGVLQIISMLIAAIFFLIWMHRAATNLRGLRSEAFQFTPGWCVGWWFVPFANLVKPLQATVEIWHGSEQPLHDCSRIPRHTPGLLKAWWSCWLLANFIGNLSWRAEGEVSDILGLVSAVFYLGAGVLLVRIMRDIETRQESFHASLLRTSALENQERAVVY